MSRQFFQETKFTLAPFEARNFADLAHATSTAGFSIPSFLDGIVILASLADDYRNANSSQFGELSRRCEGTGHTLFTTTTVSHGNSTYVHGNTATLFDIAGSRLEALTIPQRLPGMLTADVDTALRHPLFTGLVPHDAKTALKAYLECLQVERIVISGYEQATTPMHVNLVTSYHNFKDKLFIQLANVEPVSTVGYRCITIPSAAPVLTSALQQELF